MVASDWSDDMATIMSGADANQDSDHVYCLFSATFPKEARALAKEYLSTDHIRIRVGRAGSTTENITQKVSYLKNFMQVINGHLDYLRRRCKEA